MTKHSGGGTLKKRKRTNSATTREHNLELQSLMNYGTESISICSLVGGRVIRVFSILALPASNSELDRGNGWSAVFINRCLGQLGMVLDDAVWNWLILEYNQSAHLLHFTAIFVHVEEWGWLSFSCCIPVILQRQIIMTKYIKIVMKWSYWCKAVLVVPWASLVFILNF